MCLKIVCQEILSYMHVCNLFPCLFFQVRMHLRQKPWDLLIKGNNVSAGVDAFNSSCLTLKMDKVFYNLDAMT